MSKSLRFLYSSAVYFQFSNANLDGVDLDFEDDDPRGLAIGRLMRQGAQRSPSEFTRMDIRRSVFKPKHGQRVAGIYVKDC